MKSRTLTAVCALGLAAVFARAVAGTGTISVDASNVGPEISPKMYGIFLEEINHGVDGGLYAELVQNRAFEGNNPPDGGKGKFTPDPKGLPFWSLVQTGQAKGDMFADTDKPLNANTPHSIRLEAQDASGGRIGVSNEGFWGMSVVKGEKYNLSFYARCADGFTGPLTVTLESANGIAETKPIAVKGYGANWKQFKATLVGTATDPKAKLVITAGSKGKVWLDMVSLMPAKTWHNLPLRPDVAQMIADMQPKFVRFPGGCVVEGYSIKDAYNWKNTVGPVEQRPEMWNAWDYRRTHGIGMYEYMRFIEEMKSQPLFVLFSGDSCIFRGSEHVKKEDLGWVVDNYLDYLEYAMGPASSKWGGLRAKSGHPKPFQQPMIGIGNETWTEDYWTDYPIIYKAIKDKYPDVTTIACMEKEGVPIDMMDHHYYFSARWFMNTNTYDKRDRKLAPVYCGEVASPNELTDGGYNLLAALAESTFMLNCEKNADVVKMISYAPLIANVDGKTGWHGCINFDSYRVFGTPSYYAQKLFSTNCPSYDLSTTVDYTPTKPETVPGRIALEPTKMNAEFKDIKVEAGGKTLYSSDFSSEAAGWDVSPEWKVKDGALTVQGGGKASCGSTDWVNYTVSLKMKWEPTGAENEAGFNLHFANSDKMDCGFNISAGGTKSLIFGCDNTYGDKAVSAGPGKWHDIKLQYDGLNVKAWVDGELVHDITMRALYRFVAGSGVDKATGEIIVKVVNSYPEPIATTLKVSGVPAINPKATVTVMHADNYRAQNTLDNPKNVVPVTTTLDTAGPSFRYRFEPYSITVLRLKTK